MTLDRATATPFLLALESAFPDKNPQAEARFS
jgi:hypothetical protein